MSNLKFTVRPLKEKALKPFVKRISYIENETSKPQFQPIPPLGAIGLSFFFANLVRGVINQEHISLAKRAYVLGITTKGGVSVIHQGIVK